MRSTTNLLILALTGIIIIVCNVSLSAQKFKWARGWGSASGSAWISATDRGRGITTDQYGNVYTVGQFIFPTDFDPGPGTFILSPTGSDDVFISKLDAKGNFLWAKRMGGTFSNYQQEGDAGLSIVTDSLGSVYITGFFRETADFGSFVLTSNGGFDIFVCKLDTDGNFLWAKGIGGTGSDRASAISLDILGDVYVTGSFQDTVDFDPGIGIFDLQTKASSNTEMFILKLDTDGNFVWAKNFGGAFLTIGNSITTDKWGNIFVTGDFSLGTTDFDPNTGIYNVIANICNMFILKLDNFGNTIWIKAFEDFSAAGYPNFSNSIRVDHLGNIYTAGTFRMTVDFDPGPDTFLIVNSNLNNNSAVNIFISKLDSAGNFVWAKAIGGRSSVAEAIALDDSGSIYVTGMFNGRSIDFDPGIGILELSSQEDDIYILKLSKEGEFTWAEKIGGPDLELSGDIHLDKCGNIYVTGAFSRIVDFDNGPGVYNITSVGDADVFAIKLSQSKIPYITVDTFDLGVSESYSTYQWYLNGEEIPGATDSIHIATENGDYMVVVANSKGCIDSTPVYKVTNVYDDKEDQETALPEFATTAISVYPNPAGEVLYIQSFAPVQVILSGIEGKELRKANSRGMGSIDISGYTPGIYLLQIHDEYGRYIKTEKIIKQ